MPAPPAPPRRTVAVIVLDGILALARATRRAVTGRGDGARLALVAILASLSVLAATVFSIVTMLRTPERLTPVALRPAPGAAGTGTPGPTVPDEPPGPTAATPRAALRSAATMAPPAPGPPAGPPPAGRPSAATSPSPAPAALRADFAIEDSALLSYGAAVTLDNPGPVGVPDWTLVIVLPRESLTVTAVTGARVSRDGATWTFVPDGSTGTVPGRGSVRVTFRVNGAAISATPTACTIDGVACTGLPE